MFSKERTDNNILMLYGHNLSGNLKALYDYISPIQGKNFDIKYLTMDTKYYQKLKLQGVNAVLSTRLSTAFSLAHTFCIVSDHGLHTMIPLLRHSDIKFIDVWHGIPFKGFDKKDFRTQRKYDEVWVTSEMVKNIYIDKFGFDEDKVYAIGYARTDALLNNSMNTVSIKKELGLPIDSKILLFAPTWQQDDSKRSIFPFGLTKEQFLKEIDELCCNLSAHCILRTHYNMKTPSSLSNFKNVTLSPAIKYSDTESLLYISDILICDWSSIAFDYLLLHRPTIFLDTPAPFNKGFSVPKHFRYGKIVQDMSSFLHYLEQYIKNPESYTNDFSARAREVERFLYDDNADGNVAQRAYCRLISLQQQYTGRSF